MKLQIRTGHWGGPWGAYVNPDREGTVVLPPDLTAFLYLCKKPPGETGAGCSILRFKGVLGYVPDEDYLQNSHSTRQDDEQDRLLSVEPNSRPLQEMIYPDDLQYFVIKASHMVDSIFIQGVKLSIRTGLNDPERLVYYNPCLFRFVGNYNGRGYDSYHSIAGDDAWCFYVQTMHGGETDCLISARVPLYEGSRLRETTRRSIDSYRPLEGPRLDLNFFQQTYFDLLFDYPRYDDFGSTDYGGGRVYSTSYYDSNTYGATLYRGSLRMQEKYQLRTNCADAWFLRRLSVAHIIPSNSDWINNRRCVADNKRNDEDGLFWLSTETSDAGGSARPSWPSDGYQPLNYGQDCSNFPFDWDGEQ